MKDKIEFLVSKLVMVILIVIPMAFVMTAANTGLSAALWHAYPRNLSIALLAAYPCSLAVHPLAARITKKLMHMRKGPEGQNEV